MSKSRTSHRAALLGGCSVLTLAVLYYPSLAQAAAASAVLPTGGVIKAGQAQIAPPYNNNLVVTQTSSKAVIDWSSFSIGEGASVRFDNGTGATLNRTGGNSASLINGLLSASGSVYLINPAGVIVGKNGVVNVGGSFIGSSQDLTNASFLSSADPVFAGSSAASVINYGQIGALGKDVVLIAAKVENRGSISAPAGTVGLVSGYQVTLHDTALDAGRFSIDVGGPLTGVINTGAIAAANVQLRANGGNVYALAGNTGGLIRATGVTETDGRVYLIAEGGEAKVSAPIVARTASGRGGFVETSGAAIDFTGAKVDAATWLIDPYDLTIDAQAAATLSSNLATTDVIVSTSATGSAGPGVTNPAGAGDITVASAVIWGSSHSLTLSAYRNIQLNDNVTSTGGGPVVLYADNTGTGTGLVGMMAGKQVSTSGSLTLYYDPLNNPAGSGVNTNSSYGGDPAAPYRASFTGGGTLTAYYLVNTAYDLQNMRNNLAANYALGRDIDASVSTSFNNGSGYDPIGHDNGHYFSGIFDGLSRTITGYFSTAGGLFGYISGGTLRNVNLDNVNINGGVSYTGNTGFLGGIVDYLAAGSISNAHVSGSVFSNNDGTVGVGGLLGYGYGSISNSSASVAVQLNTAPTTSNALAIGGLVGAFFSGTISNSTASGSVVAQGGGSASEKVGGFVGLSGATISDSSTTASVSGGTGATGGFAGQAYGVITGSSASGQTIVATSNAGTGGFVGSFIGTSISNSTSSDAVQGGGFTAIGGFAGSNLAFIDGVTASGAISGSGQQIGGLVGYSEGTVSNSSASGTVTGSSGSAYVGGAVGVNIATASYRAGAVTNVTVSGAVSGGNWVGGVVGSNGGTLLNDQASGPVSGVSWTGGIVGINTGAVNHVSFAGATVTASGTGSGGLIGENMAGATIISSDSTGATVTAASFAGGLVGYNAGSVSASLAGDAVRGAGAAQYVGGAVGYNAGSVSGSTVNAAATVLSSGDFTGGFAGYNAGTIDSSTAAAEVTGGGNYTGGFAGDNTLTLMNDAASGAVNGGTWTGGLVGFNSGAISGGSASGSISGTATGVGGLVGYNSGAISGSSASGGAVTGSVLVGGLVGENLQNATITSSRSDGATVTGNQAVGGLVGYNYGTVNGGRSSDSVTGSSGAIYVGGVIGYNDGTTTALIGDVGGVIRNSDGQFTGGLIGFNAGSLKSGAAYNRVSTGAYSGPGSYYTGGIAGANSGSLQDVNDDGAAVTGVNQVSGGQFTGGIVGVNAGTVQRAFSTAIVNSLMGAGGLVGNNLGTITQSFATGAVTSANDIAGGLVGQNLAGGTIINSYASGAVSGVAKTGGFIGVNYGSISTSYSVGAVNQYNATPAGGFVGVNGAGATITNSYWDTGRSLRSTAAQSNSGALNNVLGDGGVTGRPTNATQSYSGFDFSSTWYIPGGATYPYLQGFTPTRLIN